MINFLDEREVFQLVLHYMAIHANNDQELHGNGQKMFSYLSYVHTMTGILQHL